MTTLRPEFMKQLLTDARETRLHENTKQDRLQVLPEFRKLICETKYQDADNIGNTRWMNFEATSKPVKRRKTKDRPIINTL